MMILTVLKAIPSIVTKVIYATKYMQRYIKLETAGPDATIVVVATSETSGVETYTTGKVVSLNLWKVIIEGYQCEDLQVPGNRHEIKLYSIKSVNPPDPCAVLV